MGRTQDTAYLLGGFVIVLLILTTALSFFPLSRDITLEPADNNNSLHLGLHHQGLRYNCNVSKDLQKEIASYGPVAKKIIDSVVYGQMQNQTWNHLSTFVDKFGSRIAGSKNLEKSIDYMLDLLNKQGLENVHGEEAPVPHWVRGEESAFLLTPRRKKLAILGLGSSVATPPNGISAAVLVVKSFDELNEKAPEAKGKIVVFNPPFIDYGTTVVFRTQGASKASRVGAVASLIRSVTPFSIYSPHTGWQSYERNVTKIPTACITVEDAEMLQRMYDQGNRIEIYLKMTAQNLPTSTSRNTVAELVGKSKPDEVVVISGHLDSWDVGQGAMDDGGGAFIAWNSLSVLSQLGLRARRTLRSILWTAEEEGLWGARHYFDVHKKDMDKFDFLLESDEGTFKPLGISFSGTPEAGCIIQEILKLLQPINATQYQSPQDGGPDISVWTNLGVPGSSLLNDNDKYYWFHHSDGDTMTVEDPHNLDLCTATWAIAAYVVADLGIPLPKHINREELEKQNLVN